MKAKVKYILAVIATVVAVSVYGQDARIAHPFLWESYYNPAHCGAEGLLKVDLGAQTSYTNLPSTFIDAHLSTEIGFGSRNATWGVGLKANNEYQGNGLLNVASINPAVSVGLRLTPERSRVYSTLRVGVSFDIGSSHINKSMMVWGDQLDAFYGKVLPQSAELQYLSNETVWNFDMSVGIYGQTAFNAYYDHDARIDYGFSVAHVIGSANESSFYTGQKSTTGMPEMYYRRFSAQLGYAHPYAYRNTNMFFKGYGIYEYQGGMNDVQFGFIYNVFRFDAGVSLKLQNYSYYTNTSGSAASEVKQNYTLTNLLFHLVYSQPLSKGGALMRIAYTFELPVSQGSVLETSIHSLSLHFVLDYHRHIHGPSECPDYTQPSDAAWYEMNGVFPNGRR